MDSASREDRLSALPDDVLRVILGCLDTRSALATAALSKQWARLPRDLPALEFKVCDVLPERYRRHLRAGVDRGQLSDALVRTLGRYERRGMRSLARSVTSFLDADNGEARRSVNAMALELFLSHNSGPFNRLIATAVGNWGVQDLEVVVLVPIPTTQCRDDVRYTFPHHVLEGSGSSADVLKKLKLCNCVPLAARSDGTGHLRTPRAFRSLTMLVLQGMPKSKPLYRRILHACPMLEVLHLKSCLYRKNISIDAPSSSRLAELVIDACTARLERLAWSGAPVAFRFGALPRLRHLSLGFYDDPNAHPDPRFAAFFGPPDEDSQLEFSSSFPDLQSLVIRFTGPEMWVLRPDADLHMPLGNLRRLLLADMPSSWNISWACLVLEAAPYLETLHVHIDHQNSWKTAYGPAIPEPPSCFKNRVLREVVILGFHGTGTQVDSVRLLMTVCTAIEKVTLVKYGCVRDKGIWDWEVTASPVACQWSDEERSVLAREINGRDNPFSPTQIIFG